MDLGDTRFSIGFQNTRDTRILTKGLEDARFSLKKYDPFGSPFEPLLELSFEFSLSRDFNNYAYSEVSIIRPGRSRLLEFKI